MRRPARQSSRPSRCKPRSVFIFETRFPLRLTEFALSTPARQAGYQDCWQGFRRRFTGIA